MDAPFRRCIVLLPLFSSFLSSLLLLLLQFRCIFRVFFWVFVSISDVRDVCLCVLTCPFSVPWVDPLRCYYILGFDVFFFSVCLFFFFLLFLHYIFLVCLFLIFFSVLCFFLCEYRKKRRHCRAESLSFLIYYYHYYFGINHNFLLTCRKVW